MFLHESLYKNIQDTWWPEGRTFDSRRCHWNFSFTSFRPHYVLGVNSASDGNKYQEYFLGGKGGRCLGLTNLQPSCADYLEIWQPQPPGTLRVWNSPAQELLHILYKHKTHYKQLHRFERFSVLTRLQSKILQHILLSYLANTKVMG
jgi:hypothetical protein